jgi:hypothetical protein
LKKSLGCEGKERVFFKEAFEGATGIAGCLLEAFWKVLSDCHNIPSKISE